MAKPSKCVITEPKDGDIIYAPKGVNVTVVVKGETDPDTNVQLVVSDRKYEKSKSDAKGKFAITSEGFARHYYPLYVIAGVDPDTTRSNLVGITVKDEIPKPSKLTVTDPKQNQIFYIKYQNGETGATVSFRGSTDPEIRVAVVIDGKELYVSKSDTKGNYSLNEGFGQGYHKRYVWAGSMRAGTPPGVLESPLKWVQEYERPSLKQSLRYYLNWMARTFEPNGSYPLTEKDAACRWAGLNSNQYGLVAALNKLAGRKPAEPQWTVNHCLNHLAKSAGLSNSRAAFVVCWKTVTDDPLPPAFYDWCDTGDDDG